MAELDNELKEVSIRIKLVEGGMFGNVQINEPQDAIRAMKNLLSDLDREYVMVLNLNTRGIPLNYNLVSIGSLRSSTMSVSNVFKSAILANASSVLVMHNHPSGVVYPSIQDDMATKRMIAAGALMEIPVMDHIIVGNESEKYFSYREMRNEMFPLNNEVNKVWDTLVPMIQEQEVRKNVRTR